MILADEQTRFEALEQFLRAQCILREKLSLELYPDRLTPKLDPRILEDISDPAGSRKNFYRGTMVPLDAKSSELKGKTFNMSMTNARFFGGARHGMVTALLNANSAICPETNDEPYYPREVYRRTDLVLFGETLFVPKDMTDQEVKDLVFERLFKREKR